MEFEVYEPNINTSIKSTFVQNMVDTTAVDSQRNALAQLPKLLATTDSPTFTGTVTLPSV
jgi:hypothetical protein